MQVRALGVKQFVAVVRGPFCCFTVFTTGDTRYYLFVPMRPDGTSGTLQFPVLKSRLRDDVRSALAHGWGNASGGAD